MSATIRPIRAEEWPLGRNLRLRALAEAPNAFRSTLAEESGQSDSWWEDLVGRTALHPHASLWVAESNGEAVGKTFARLSPDRDLLSIGAMWVAPEARRAGIGQGLLNAAVDWGREEGAQKAGLWVTEGNSAAELLYAGAGFQPTDDTRPLRQGSSFTERRLVCHL